MDTNALLQRFVATTADARDFLHTPILRGELVYATNGYIAVRDPAAPGIEASNRERPANIAKLFDNNKRADYVTMPKLPPAKNCGYCDGSGRAYRRTECDGEGVFTHHDREYDCMGCFSTGQVEHGEGATVPCDRCNGSGHAQQPIVIGGRHYDRRY